MRNELRDSCETRETPCAIPAKQPRKSAKQPRDSRESDAKPCRKTVAVRAEAAEPARAPPHEPLAAESCAADGIAASPRA
eukprot:5688922-Prymnesium_polylepis.1